CFFQAEDGIRGDLVTGVQTCALPISRGWCCADLESGDHGGRGARRYCVSPPISHVRLLSNPACPAGAAVTAVSLRTSFDEPVVVAAGSLGTRLFAFSFVRFNANTVVIVPRMGPSNRVN